LDQSPHDEFTDFVRGRSRSLQRSAYLLTGDWGLAEDLVQSALARSYLGWARIHADDPERYVQKVMLNTWLSWWRRRWRAETPTEVLLDVTSDSWGQTDESVAMHAALARLPKRQRAVVVLRYYNDLTERGRQHDCSTSASARSRAILRKRSSGYAKSLAQHHNHRPRGLAHSTGGKEKHDS